MATCPIRSGERETFGDLYSRPLLMGRPKHPTKRLAYIGLSRATSCGCWRNNCHIIVVCRNTASNSVFRQYEVVYSQSEFDIRSFLSGQCHPLWPVQQCLLSAPHFCLSKEYQQGQQISDQARPTRLPVYWYATIRRFGGFMDIPTSSHRSQRCKAASWALHVEKKRGALGGSDN
ncbi:hypothetical protein CRG98_021766 [Punica granatum]|uniref:Uncharacterized protein n=1 Tax=Punica granatum TaxID=22663 RepID=A0A2I0JPP0_PUNGR|nr:hypothetical protein CRG98_021766 [Punica granatum]